jgi:proteasome accessory factor C
MSPRPVAGTEIQRILAIVPWIVAHPGAAKRDIAARFGMTVEQLDDDLALVLMIGVPPYSPGDYLDVDDDGEFVTIRLADQFSRPLRLTPAEGLALLAAGRALLAVPGSDPEGPLATALGKLERALDLPEVGVAVGEPTFLEAVRDAAARGERVEIDYWSAGRDELTTRRIDPEVAFFAMGEWYLSAYCHRAEDERMFRVDRIRALRPTGEHFDATPRDEEIAEVFSPRPDDPRVTLELAPAAAWVAEAYPAESTTTRPDGTIEVVLAVSEPAWLERLLVRLGPDARVVEPVTARGAGRDAARRVLARYTGGSVDEQNGREDHTAGSDDRRPDPSAPERA